MRHGRAQSATPFAEPWPGRGWPDVPTRFLLCRNDRFFPPEFLRRVVKDRLGITPDEMDSGHLPALSHPTELTDRLEGYRAEAPDTGPRRRAPA
jgi:pimeloyl-ACP methyl ester carboxylesterase